MADHTQPPPSRTEPVRSIRWCHWHEDVTTDDTVLISAAEKISGPPHMQYACRPCVQRHNLTPL